VSPIELAGLLVVTTGRVSAAIFAAALAVPVLWRRTARWSPWWLGAFAAVHTMHFAAVAWLTVLTGGGGLFPGGRSLTDVGGWPALLAIYALFYLLVSIGIGARARPGHRGLRIADRVATTFIALMFVATYTPLIAASWWFAAPSIGVIAALVVYAFGDRARTWRCLVRAPA
jgi:hypothetical protein